MRERNEWYLQEFTNVPPISDVFSIISVFVIKISDKPTAIGLGLRYNEPFWYLYKLSMRCTHVDIRIYNTLHGGFPKKSNIPELTTCSIPERPLSGSFNFPVLVKGNWPEQSDLMWYMYSPHCSNSRPYPSEGFGISKKVYNGGQFSFQLPLAQPRSCLSHRIA